MQLFEVDRVLQRANFLEIQMFHDRLGKAHLACTNLHAWKGYRGDDSLLASTRDLKKGDKIFIDVGIFRSDGSLKTKN